PGGPRGTLQDGLEAMAFDMNVMPSGKRGTGFVPPGRGGTLQDGGRGGGGDTVVNLHITAVLPGMGTFESGEISQRVAENEGQLIDMRISMAATSV
ncbi:unnamed protein product, partial [marine sediment metagenome]